MMSRSTGQNIDLLEHIKQSIQDILTTRIGSRIMRRAYGSLLFELIDQPTNDALILQIYSAVYVAILTWEERINLTRVQVRWILAGMVEVELDGELSSKNTPFSLNIPLEMGAFI